MARNPDAEEFGRDVVAKARDQAIEFFKKCASGQQLNGGDELRTHINRLAELPKSQAKEVEYWVRYGIDLAIANLLSRLDEKHALDDLKLTLHETDVVYESDGLAGSLYGRNGWFGLYSDFGGDDKT